MIQTLHDKILDFQGVEKVCCVVVGQKSDLGGVRLVYTKADSASGWVGLGRLTWIPTASTI